MKPLLIGSSQLGFFLKKKAIFFESELGVKIKQALDLESVRNHYTIEGNKATIPIKGELIFDNYFFADWVGGTVTSSIIASVKECIKNPKIKEIVFDIDSQGGEVGGIAELSDLIYSNRENIKTSANIRGVCFSAGYWIASACEVITASPYSMLGNIGAVIQFMDNCEGIVTLVSQVSPDKIPSKENGYESLQKMVNAYGDQFVSHVARNRGIDRAKVLNEYGKGKIFTSNEFFSLGAIDRIAGVSYDSSRTMKVQIKSFLKNIKKRAALILVNDEEIELPENAEVMSLEEITTDWIKENLPEVAQELIDEGASGEEKPEPEQEQEQEPASETKEVLEKTAGLKTSLLNIKAIMSIQTFTDDEAKIQKEAVARGHSEARFLNDLMSLRLKSTGRHTSVYQKETSDLDVTPNSESQESQNKASLLEIAKTSMKSKLGA